MNDNLKAFIQKASEDSELQEKLIEMNESILEEAKKRFVKLAEENGYSFSAADIEELYAEASEVSEDELKAVSGGAYTQRHKDGRLMSACGCTAFGHGSADQYQKKCFCALGGCGNLTDYGKERVRAGDIHYTGKSGTPVAMWCLGVGTAGYED